MSFVPNPLCRSPSAMPAPLKSPSTMLLRRTDGAPYEPPRLSEAEILAADGASDAEIADFLKRYPPGCEAKETPAVKPQQDEALPTPVLLNECAPSVKPAVKPAVKSEPKIGLRRTDYDGLVYEPGGTALMRGPAPLLRSPCVLNYQDV